MGPSPAGGPVRAERSPRRRGGGSGSGICPQPASLSCRHLAPGELPTTSSWLRVMLGAVGAAVTAILSLSLFRALLKSR